MLNVKIAGVSARYAFKSDLPIAVHELRQRIEETTGLSCDQYYIVNNGRLMHGSDICFGDTTIVPRLLGGKGGFGSMLRAIGAQIEKTTNREACRDLSGRRLRDINEEKRLKAWIEKQTAREEEAAQRKKKKLEKLCAEPRHEFKDKRYEQERAELTEKVGDAVEEGFKVAVASGTKRKLEEDIKPNKRKTMFDLDIDSDELGTSDDSDNDDAEKRSKADQQTSNDSGHSTDEGDRTSESFTEKIEDKTSETSSDNQINDNIPTTETADIKCTVECTEISKNQSVNSEKEAVV